GVAQAGALRRGGGAGDGLIYSAFSAQLYAVAPRRPAESPAGPARARARPLPRTAAPAVGRRWKGTMPKRTDIESILLLGSGPIVIGQAAEFDYSGTQAVRALREEGYRVILVNSNPATIMTDPDLADRTYIEPITPEWVERVIERERPDAILPTMGGQTALNVALDLHDSGVLDRYGVELIGANARALRMAEDRSEFADAMVRIGLKVPHGGFAKSLDEALVIVEDTGFPAIIRPSFTLGGTGGGIAYNRAEFEEQVRSGLSLS